MLTTATDCKLGVVTTAETAEGTTVVGWAPDATVVGTAGAVVAAGPFRGSAAPPTTMAAAAPPCGGDLRAERGLDRRRTTRQMLFIPFADLELNTAVELCLQKKRDVIQLESLFFQSLFNSRRVNHMKWRH